MNVILITHNFFCFSNLDREETDIKFWAPAGVGTIDEIAKLQKYSFQD